MNYALLAAHLLVSLVWTSKQISLLFRPLHHRQIMAGLRLQPERHTGVVLRHHLVEETFGLHREALPARVTAYVPAAFVGLLGVSAQTQLPHDAVEGLPDIVLHGSWGLNELAVKHSSAGTTLWGAKSQVSAHIEKKTHSDSCASHSKGFLLLTVDWHLPASHQVTLVPHQDDWRVLGGTEAPQGDPELRGSQEGGSVGYGVQQQVGITCLHVALLSPFTVSLKTHTRVRDMWTFRVMCSSDPHESGWSVSFLSPLHPRCPAESQWQVLHPLRCSFHKFHLKLNKTNTFFHCCDHSATKSSELNMIILYYQHH